MSNTSNAVKSDINEQFLNRKSQFVKLQKDDKLKNIRLDENYMDELLKHHWIVDSYIARFGFVTDNAPENTIKAYKEAVKKNYPILISVQCLDDGEIICYNYKTLSKITNESSYISKMTINEIKEYGIGESNEKIPTLQEALNEIKGKVPVIIDIINEGNVGKFEQKVVDIVEEYITKFDLFDSVAIMSLNPYTLNWFLTQAPWLPRILRSGKFKVKSFAGIKTRKLRKLKLHKIALPDYVCYNAKDLPCKYIKKVKPVGVLAYNVKSQNEYMEVAKYCDNIIFDGFDPEI